MISAKLLLLAGLLMGFSAGCGETDAPKHPTGTHSSGGNGRSGGGPGTPEGNSAQAGTGGLAAGGAHSAGGPGTEEGSLGAPEVLADDFVFLARLAVDESHVYLPNRPQFLPQDTPETDTQMEGIYAVPTAGGEKTFLAPVRSPATVAIVEGELWVSGQTPAILALDKSSGAELQSIALPGLAVAMAQSVSQVYVSTVPAAISALPIAGGSAKAMLLPDSVVGFNPFWMDAVANELAVSMYSPDERTELLYFQNTSVDDPAVSVLSRSGLFVGVLIMEDALLVADNVQGTVERVPKDGSAPSVLVPLPGAWALAMDAVHIYATARPDIDDCTAAGMGQLVRFKHDGTDLEVLAEGLDCPSEVKVTANAIYWVNSGVAGTDESDLLFVLPGSSVMRMQKH